MTIVLEQECKGEAHTVVDELQSHGKAHGGSHQPLCRCVCWVSDCPWLEIGVEGFTGELEGRSLSFSRSLSLSFLLPCTLSHTVSQHTHTCTLTARPAHTKISLYAHARPAGMIKVLCRRDPKRHCAAAACFPSWIWANSAVFSSGTETRHHKRKIRGNYVVICQMKYFCNRNGIPFASNLEQIYSTRQLFIHYRQFIDLFADVSAAFIVRLSLSSGPSGIGDQSCYSVDQSFWSGEIIGIAEISMRWWMIDNITAVIDQWDIADKTLKAASVALSHLIFMHKMGKINTAEQSSLFHCIDF